LVKVCFYQTDAIPYCPAIFRQQGRSITQRFLCNPGPDQETIFCRLPDCFVSIVARLVPIERLGEPLLDLFVLRGLVLRIHIFCAIASIEEDRRLTGLEEALIGGFSFVYCARGIDSTIRLEVVSWLQASLDSKTRRHWRREMKRPDSSFNRRLTKHQ
jgi:hypothetical protein